MNKSKLPQINNLDLSKIKVKWEITPLALERWNPQAAADEGATVSIFEGIGDMGDGTGMTAKRMSGILRANKGKDISVAINSPGGSFFEGVAIYNLLREHDGKVTVKVVGLAASAASIIAMAGDEVKMGTASFMMIHNSWSIVMGNRNELKKAYDELAAFDESMAAVYSARTGIESKAISKLMDADSWLSGPDAVDMGFADSLSDEEKPREEKQNKKNASLRAIDTALAKQGIPRSQRRDMLKDLTGTHDAASDDITPSADIEVLKQLASIFK